MRSGPATLKAVPGEQGSCPPAPRMPMAPGCATDKALWQRRRLHLWAPGCGARRPARLRGRIKLVVLLAAKLDHQRGLAAVGLNVPCVTHELLPIEHVLRVRQLQHEQAARAQRGAARGQRGRRGVVAQRVRQRAQRQERYVRGCADLRAAPVWTTAIMGSVEPCSEALAGSQDGRKCEPLSSRPGSDLSEAAAAWRSGRLPCSACERRKTAAHRQAEVSHVGFQEGHPRAGGRRQLARIRQHARVVVKRICLCAPPGQLDRVPPGAAPGYARQRMSACLLAAYRKLNTISAVRKRHKGPHPTSKNVCACRPHSFLCTSCRNCACRAAGGFSVSSKH